MPLGLFFELTAAEARSGIFSLWDIMPQGSAKFEGRICFIAEKSRAGVPAAVALECRVVGENNQASAWATYPGSSINIGTGNLVGIDQLAASLNLQYRFLLSPGNGWQAADSMKVAICV